MTTYAQALRFAAERLRRAGVASPEWDARILASHLIHCGHMDIPMHEKAMPGFDIAYEQLIARRAAREPLQHLLGAAWFGPLELRVGPGVFIPRPETEVLADWAVRSLQGLESPRVVDLCTGSGALALYVSHLRPDARVLAVELDDDALAYTTTNTHGSGVEVIHADATDPRVLESIDGQVDLVVSNPPYVPLSMDLDPEVYQDPALAVFAGEDGMSVIPGIADTAARLLKVGGRFGIEHDDETSAQVQALVRENGAFCAVEVLRDLTGTARFVTAVRAEG